MEANPAKPLPHIAIFDGLRGLAILMVIAVHASFCFAGSEGLSKVLAQGMFGVQVFFAVSAATLMLASSRRTTVDLVPFAVRRIARIAPLYYVGIAFYVAVHVMSNQRHAPQGVALNALFLHGFVPEFQNDIVPGGWSIGCEMAFYVAFPLLFRWITSLPRALAFLCGTCLLDVVLLLAGRANGWDLTPSEGLYYDPLFQMPVFAAGIAAYLAVKDKPVAQGARRGGMYALAAGSLVGIVLAGVVAMSHPGVRAGVLLPVALLVGSFVYGCISAPPRLLTHPFMVRLGLISFSVYIWHFAVLFGVLRGRPFFGHPVPVLVGIALTLLLTWPLAELSRRYVEQPGIALGRRVLDRLRTRPVVDAGSTTGSLR